MRISTAQFYEVSAANYQRTYANVIATGNEVASQVKLNTAADDPVGAARVLQLQQQNAMLDQYKSNISTVNSNATQAETAMKSIETALQRAQELIIGASNASYTDLDRQANASELAGLQTEIAGLMNSQDASGKYLFSGSKSSTPPYSLNADGTYSYNGDQTSIKLAIGDGLQVASNTTGWDAFEQALNTTRTSATLTSPATDDGKVTLSGGIVTSTADYDSKFVDGQPYTVKFISSTQIEIRDANNNAVTSEVSQGGVISSASDANQSVSFRGVTLNLNINLTDAERADIGTTDPVAGHTFTLGISPSNVSTTRMPSNTSSAVVSSAVVTDASAYNKSFPEGGAVLRLTSATTFGLYSSPYTAGDTAVSTGNLVSTTTPPATTPVYSATASGVTFTFSAQPEDQDQYVANTTTNQTQNVLNTLTSAIKALNTPTDGSVVTKQKLQAALDSALGNIKSASNQLGIATADGGTRQVVASNQGTTNDTQSASNTAEQATITDADPVESIAKLTLQKTMLTASQLVFTQVSQLNLFSKL